jgi:hypothetical protein
LEKDNISFVGEDTPEVKDKVDSDSYKKINDIAQKTNRPIKIGLPDSTDALKAFENSMDLTNMYFKPDSKAFDLENIEDDKTIIDVNAKPIIDEVPAKFNFNKETQAKDIPKTIDIDPDDKNTDSLTTIGQNQKSMEKPQIVSVIKNGND